MLAAKLTQRLTSVTPTSVREKFDDFDFILFFFSLREVGNFNSLYTVRYSNILNYWRVLFLIYLVHGSLAEVMTFTELWFWKLWSSRNAEFYWKWKLWKKLFAKNISTQVKKDLNLKSWALMLSRWSRTVVIRWFKLLFSVNLPSLMIYCISF